MILRVEDNHPCHEPNEQAKDASAEQDDPAILPELHLQFVVFLPARFEVELAVFVVVHPPSIDRQMGRLLLER